MGQTEKQKIITITASTLLLCLSFIFADDLFAQRALNDYQYQYEKYREVHNKYTVSRDKYLKYQTLSTRDEALQAVKSAALQRDRVLRTYLIVLRNRVNDSLVSPVLLKEESLEELNDWIDEIEEHQNELGNVPIDSYEDLFDTVEDVEAEQVNIYRTFYKSLLIIELGKIQEAQQESAFLSEDLSAYAREFDKREELDFWLSTVRGKNRASEDRSNQVKDLFPELDEADSLSSVRNVYLEIKAVLEESRSELNKSASYQDEIYKEISNE